MDSTIFRPKKNICTLVTNMHTHVLIITNRPSPLTHNLQKSSHTRYKTFSIITPRSFLCPSSSLKPIIPPAAVLPPHARRQLRRPATDPPAASSLRARAAVRRAASPPRPPSEGSREPHGRLSPRGPLTALGMATSALLRALRRPSSEAALRFVSGV